MLVVLNGMSGPSTIKGRSYNGSMPGFGHLSNAEIAAVVHYIHDARGNASGVTQMNPVTPELVAQQRMHPLSPSEVHAHREK